MFPNRYRRPSQHRGFCGVSGVRRWLRRALLSSLGLQFGTTLPQMRRQQHRRRVMNQVQPFHLNLQSTGLLSPQPPRPVQVVRKFMSISSEGNRVRYALSKRVDLQPRYVFDISVRAGRATTLEAFKALPRESPQILGGTEHVGSDFQATGTSSSLAAGSRWRSEMFRKRLHLLRLA
jgi:hypothetical protein